MNKFGCSIVPVMVRGVGKRFQIRNADGTKVRHLYPTRRGAYAAAQQMERNRLTVRSAPIQS